MPHRRQLDCVKHRVKLLHDQDCAFHKFIFVAYRTNLVLLKSWYHVSPSPRLDYKGDIPGCLTLNSMTLASGLVLLFGLHSIAAEFKTAPYHDIMGVDIPKTQDPAYSRHQPYLNFFSTCQAFPAVNNAGVVSAGGGSTATSCSKGWAQAYVARRETDKNDHFRARLISMRGLVRFSHHGRRRQTVSMLSGMLL